MFLIIIANEKEKDWFSLSVCAAHAWKLVYFYRPTTSSSAAATTLALAFVVAAGAQYCLSLAEHAINLCMQKWAHARHRNRYLLYEITRHIRPSLWTHTQSHTQPRFEKQIKNLLRTNKLYRNLIWSSSIIWTYTHDVSLTKTIGVGLNQITYPRRTKTFCDRKLNHFQTPKQNSKRDLMGRLCDNNR